MCLRSTTLPLRPSSPLSLQAADRVLVITESQPSLNPALAAPTGAPGAAEPSQRPDLALQHVRVPQQYLESNYPLVGGGSLRG